MADLQLASWIEEQWKIRKKLFSAEKTPKIKEKILYSLAKLLRQYINTLKTNQGLGTEQKKKAYSMTSWLQGELLKGNWSASVSSVFDAILYARKHSGNIAQEGRALRNALAKSERIRLASVTRKANARFERGFSQLDSKDLDRSDELRDLGLLPDNPQMDSPSDPGGLDDRRNGDS